MYFKFGDYSFMFGSEPYFGDKVCYVTHNNYYRYYAIRDNKIVSENLPEEIIDHINRILSLKEFIW